MRSKNKINPHIKMNSKNKECNKKITILKTNKKGLAYIDWIISMGLFIVVVIAIFAFLKPGAKPIHESKGLINILETNFFVCF